ncbi:MAG: hypothetical protein IJJ76_04810 [Ruminococcus sp.]|uniref:hypothetical protein n=1 Tax=Ruminococcus sp. TaxID=41978 RepID=UPI0025E1BF20|nr:hypothetical protein [Ruminococcus sp.]MBR0529069.1 hypothetical protein [Ruminococcus sp.]
MKLNYRDRIVLTILIVILVWVAGIMLFIKPAIERVQDSQAALDSAKATRSDLRDRVEADKDLKERIEAAYKEVNTLTESFYDIQETQIASQQIDDLLAEDEVKNLDITISPYTIHQIDPYTYVDPTVVTDSDLMVEEYMSQGQTAITPETAPAEGEAVAASATIGSYEISFNFEGKVENVQAFCEHMKNKNVQKTMTISNIEYEFKMEDGKEEDGEKVQSEDQVSGSMTLTMMVVQRLPDPNTLAVAEAE